MVLICLLLLSRTPLVLSTNPQLRTYAIKENVKINIFELELVFFTFDIGLKGPISLGRTPFNLPLQFDLGDLKSNQILSYVNVMGVSFYRSRTIVKYSDLTSLSSHLITGLSNVFTK
jgi:hypothetical protein